MLPISKVGSDWWSQKKVVDIVMSSSWSPCFFGVIAASNKKPELADPSGTSLAPLKKILLPLAGKSREHFGASVWASKGRGETFIGGPEENKGRGETEIFILAIRPSTIGMNSILVAIGYLAFDTKKPTPPALVHGMS